MSVAVVGDERVTLPETLGECDAFVEEDGSLCRREVDRVVCADKKTDCDDSLR